jgi:hypothetical protein
MIKKLGLFGAALATVAGATVAAAPAEAQYYGNGYNRGHYGNGGYGQRYQGNRYGNGYAGARYGNGYYGNQYNGRNSYNYRYRCGNGTTGTVLGAIVGGLLGDAAVGRRGDGTAGAIVGAGVGALAGRAIERNGSRC